MNKMPLWATGKLGEWYVKTPKWVLAQALRQLAALQSDDGCDLGLDGNSETGWFPIARRECELQHKHDMTR